jgi:hypothetical protein
MSIASPINERLYRHANFLQKLVLNEHETKLLRLFLKVTPIYPIDDKESILIEDHTRNNRKVAVEF